MENKLVEITEVEQKREKRLKRNEDSLRELWDNVKHPYYRSTRRRREREREEKIVEEIIAENLPNMGKESLTQIQKAQLPHKINPRRKTPKHILIKLTKIKDKEKILKAAREKK